MTRQHYFMYPRVSELRTARPNVRSGGRPAQRDLVLASLLRRPDRGTAKGRTA
jgi:Flp pilus assembly CpaF family ATPase